MVVVTSSLEYPTEPMRPLGRRACLVRTQCRVGNKAMSTCGMLSPRCVCVCVCMCVCVRACVCVCVCVCMRERLTCRGGNPHARRPLRDQFLDRVDLDRGRHLLSTASDLKRGSDGATSALGRVCGHLENGCVDPNAGRRTLPPLSGPLWGHGSLGHARPARAVRVHAKKRAHKHTWNETRSVMWEILEGPSIGLSCLGMHRACAAWPCCSLATIASLASLLATKAPTSLACETTCDLYLRHDKRDGRWGVGRQFV